MTHMGRLLSSSLLALSITVTFMAGCQQGNQYKPPPPPTVTVAQPVQQDVTVYVEYLATTAAYQEVDIVARVKGFLEEVHFADGAIVNRGELLYVIERATYEAKLDKAKAEWVAAKDKAKATDIEYKRIAKLFAMGNASESELNKAEAEKLIADGAVKATEATVKDAENNLSYTMIYAPISGRAGRNLVDAGNLVGDGVATKLTTIVHEDLIHVYFNVSQSDLLQYIDKSKTRSDETHRAVGLWQGLRVASVLGYMAYPCKTGLSAGVTSYQHFGDIPPVVIYMKRKNETEFIHKGFVDFVDNEIDPDLGTLEVRAVFPNPPTDNKGKIRLFLPNMSVRVRIPIGLSSDALLIPEEAVGADQAGKYIVLVNEKKEVERKKVELGVVVGGFVEIKTGLQPKQWVVVNGLQRAQPGATVQPKKTKLKPPPTKSK